MHRNAENQTTNAEINLETPHKQVGQTHPSRFQETEIIPSQKGALARRGQRGSALLKQVDQTKKAETMAGKEGHSRQNKLSYAAGFLMLVLTSACSEGVVSADMTVLPPEGWSNKRVVQHAFEIQDTTQTYDLELIVRHRQEYPYSNLLLVTQWVTSDGDTQTDSLALDVADAQGRWLGSGKGASITTKWLIKENQPLEAGKHVLRIRQVMRQLGALEGLDPLPAVDAVGYTLYTHSDEKETSR